MTDLRPVEHAHLRAIIGLSVPEDQKTYVAPNAHTLAQGPYEGGAHPMGIWDGETLVGFLCAIIMRENLHLDEGDDPEGVYLWRFMIAEGHQRQGHGRAALNALFDWARARGHRKMYLSVVKENAAGLAFYEAVGFARTGRVVDDEIEFQRDL